MTLPIAFHDLPPDAFPIVITFTAKRTGATVHQMRMDGPGVLHVPPLTEHGPVTVRVLYGDGTEVTV